MGKNTLSDLNEFLNKKPTTLVDLNNSGSSFQSLEELADLIIKLSKEKNIDCREILLDLIQLVIEKKEDKNATDIVLMNLTLYMKYTEDLAR